MSKLRIITLTTLSTGEAVHTVIARPEQGKEWLVMVANGWHTDATGRVCRWYLRSFGQEMNLNLATRAQTVRVSPYLEYAGTAPGANTMVPIKLRYDCYLVWEVAAIAGASYVRADLYVEESDGVSND